MINITEEDIDKLAEEKTVEILHVGTDKINYRILKMLPTDINQVMTELNLTKVPVYTRINNLENAGFLEKNKGTGEIIETKFTGNFLNFIDSVKKGVSKYIKLQGSEYLLSAQKTTAVSSE